MIDTKSDSEFSRKQREKICTKLMEAYPGSFKIGAESAQLDITTDKELIKAVVAMSGLNFYKPDLVIKESLGDTSRLISIRLEYLNSCQYNITLRIDPYKVIRINVGRLLDGTLGC